MSWQLIETAPKTKGGYLFCYLAWGYEDDPCTGAGFGFGGKWFAAALFYKGGKYDGCQYELRQIEVEPTHWMPTPDGPII